MKVLVTGKSGKFATYFRKYVSENKNEWTFDFISVRDDEWEKKDISGYDAVIHCAGITTAPNDNYEDFFRINVELTKNIFKKAVMQNVGHFIYLSSMAVYDGIAWGFGKEGLITDDTQPKQKSNYGKSKFEAEKAICSIKAENIKVAIIRAPAIIGGDLEAYFSRYIKFSNIPLIPIPWIHTEAKRSFVYIDTLIEFMCALMAHEKEGLFFPQNFPLLSVSEIMREVCEASGNRKGTSRIIGKMIPHAVQKRFFSQISYEEALSLEENKVSPVSSKEAIRRVIKGYNK